MWVSGNYQRIGGGFHAFGDDMESCAAQGMLYDGNTDSCYTEQQQGTMWGGSPAPSPSPSPSPGGGGGGGGGGPTSPSPSSKAAGMVGSATPWLLGGAVLLGIVYFAATSKKAHHR
jgi:hypothetical protein